MEHFTFLKNYKDDEKNRSSLNTLLQLNFGFSLEAWYARGYWQEQYIPYSFTDGTQIIANVSVYKQDVVYEGEEKTAIRLEHIMLHPKYHYKNLIEKLIDYITETYKDQVELIYLTMDEAVTPFYPRLGFQHIEEMQTYIASEKIQSGEMPIIVSPESMVEKVKTYPSNYRVISKSLKSKDDFLRRSFNYMTAQCENLYYFEDLDTYVVAQIKEDELEIMDIASEHEIDIDKIISGFKAKYKFSKVKLDSELQYHGSGEVKEEIGDNLLFIKTAPVQEENLFPIIIEA